MPVFIAGPSCAGKTTLCRILDIDGRCQCVEVNTRPCRRLRNLLLRQLCYTILVAIYSARARGNVCLDNSLLSVYGYTMAYAEASGNRVVALALRAVGRLAKLLWRLLERRRGTIVSLLDVDESRLRERCEIRDGGSTPEGWSAEHVARMGVAAARHMKRAIEEA